MLKIEKENGYIEIFRPSVWWAHGCYNSMIEYQGDKDRSMCIGVIWVEVDGLRCSRKVKINPMIIKGAEVDILQQLINETMEWAVEDLKRQ